MKTVPACPISVSEILCIVGPEVLKEDQRLADAVILDSNSLCGSWLADKELVRGVLADAMHTDSLAAEYAELAIALCKHTAIRAIILQHNLHPGLNGNFLGGHVFVAITDPLFSQSGLA